jgi:5-methylcytosine-specific restriction enzyme subunit McrC
MAEFVIKEQQIFSEEQKNKLREMNLDFSDEKKYLGLDPRTYAVKYYIGIDWLKENEAYILVQPKIEKLDYIEMFMHCLKHSEISKYVSEIYHFDFNQPKITPDTQIEMDFNLFLIAHFLNLVQKITEQGLKKNYIKIEENLSSKIKGKIIWAQQIKKNIVAKREDRVFCRYQEYSVNCLENRLIKKTLLMVQRYLRHFDKKQTQPLVQQHKRLLHAFENISDDVSYSQIKQIKVNSLYKEYVEAIDLAKKIMEKFGYSFANANKKPVEKEGKKYDKEISPFWIDMSKLFELHVYSLLRDEFGKEILYQPHGKYGEVDFLKIDEQLILDAKYKEVYTKKWENLRNNERDSVAKDIRQLSGYARDWGVLKKLGISEDTTVVDCVIIYPDDNSSENLKGRNLKKTETEIQQFTKFYKCGIKLPLK